VSGGNRRDVKAHLGEHTIRITLTENVRSVCERIEKIVDTKS